MRIKVLHVVEALGGGIYSYFLDLCQQLGDDSDLELILVYNDKRKEVESDKIIAAFHPKIQLIKLDMPQGINLFKDLSAAKALHKIYKREKPDVIHLHSSKAGAIGRMAYFLYKKKPPLLYTPHGYSFLRKDVSPMKRKVFVLMEKYLAKMFGGITLACGDTEYLKAQELAGEALLVRNGINPGEIQKYRSHGVNEAPIVGILGRITYARNPGLFNEIAKSFPELQFKWIGDGELRHTLTAPNITITGWFTEREEGLRQLDTLDIYFQPSLWEGLPISVLEAMSMGKPVLASNIIGNKDVVAHEKTGYLFNDTEELKQYLTLLFDKDRRGVMGSAGLARVSERFDCRKNFMKLKKIYTDLAGNNSLHTN